MPGTDRAPASVKEGVDVRTRDDRDLVGAARRGSRRAQAELVRRHWEGARRRAYAVVGRRALAEDVAQEAMAAARRGRPALARPACRRGAALLTAAHPGEIAEALEVPVGTVNSRLARALADLRAVLEESSRA